MNPHCRVRKIRMKSGGMIERLPTPPRNERQAHIIDAARKVASGFKHGELSGHVVLGWDKDGAYSVGYFVSDDGSIGRALLPSWVADVIRRSLIADGHWD